MKVEEAIKVIKSNMPTKGTYTILTEALELAIQALEKQTNTKYREAFKYVADFAAGETHKRKYPHETVKKLSESLMLLDAYFMNEEVEE